MPINAEHCFWREILGFEKLVMSLSIFVLDWKLWDFEILGFPIFFFNHSLLKPHASVFSSVNPFLSVHDAV